jgi:hypothetical protein
MSARPDVGLNGLGRLYVVGGRQRRLLMKDREEQYLYEAGVVLEVNGTTGEARICMEYRSPADVAAPSILFKSAALCERRLYLCTSTEILIVEVPSFYQIGHISLPCFNDLHHVRPTSEGNLLVVNTGLDMVLMLDLEGKVLTEWDVLGEPLWTRFSRQMDYRKVASTKPHRSHPNFVFELEGHVWVTRFAQRDAICLTDPGKCILLPGEGPHDGVMIDDQILFTAVDGKVLIADRETKSIRSTIDLNEISPRPTLLGWCRGLLPLEQRLWVGFTRVRKTALIENILWVKHRFRESEQPTHIALYDLKAKELLKEFDLEQFGLNVIFGIYPA